MEQEESKKSSVQSTVNEVTSLLRQFLFVTQPKPAGNPLHQLPPLPPSFTGRAAELAQLAEMLESGVAAGVVLQGPDGIGKTALALKLAERLAPVYCDAQFFIDLRGGANQQPLAPDDAMAHVIHAYHPTIRLPESLNELDQLYRGVLRGRRTLLVLDNAAAAAQIEPLIPPAGCVLLATTQQIGDSFALPGLFVKQLEALSAAESRELLLALAPRAGEEAEQLVELCGRLPWALRLAAGALATRANLMPDAYARRLARQRQRLPPMEAALNLNCEMLPLPKQRRWRMLSVFPATFEAQAAEVIWGGKPELKWPVSAAAARELDEMVDMGLLEWNEELRRYYLHEVARPFARKRLSVGEAETVARRHAEHYLNVLKGARMLDYAGSEGTVVGLAMCDIDRWNIAAGRSWAVAHATRSREAAQWVTDYFYLGISLMIFRLHPAEVDQWLNDALAAARAIGDWERESELLGQLGNAYQDLGKVRLAIEYFQKALAAAREIGDEEGERRALGGLGDAYQAAGEMEKAIETYLQYLDQAREIGDRQVEGYLLNNLGAAYGNMGQPAQAIEYFQKHLAITRETGDRFHEAHVLDNIGSAYASSGDPRKAIEYFEQALTIIRQLGDRSGEGQVLGHLGNAYFLLGETHQAIKTYEQALTINRKMGDRHNTGEVLWNLSLALDRLGNRARAIECAEAALRIQEELEDPHAEQVHRQLARWRGK